MAITYSQSTHTSALAAASGLTCAYGGNNTAGNLLVAGVVYDTTDSDVVSSLTDSAGNTWSRCPNTFADDATRTLPIVLYYSPNCASGTNVVTANFSSSVGERSLILAEYAGVQSLTPLDQSTAQAVSTNQTAWSSTTVTTTTDGQLVVGFGVPTTGNPTITAGTNLSFTIREGFADAAGENLAFEDAIQTTQGAVDARFVAGAATRYECAIATFKATGGSVDRDVLIRYGSMLATSGSGLVTAAFLTDVVPGAAGNYQWYYANVVEDLI